jgi:hypothetical protein
LAASKLRQAHRTLLIPGCEDDDAGLIANDALSHLERLPLGTTRAVHNYLGLDDLQGHTRTQQAQFVQLIKV